MAMTLEEFDAMPGHMELPYDEREELKRMYGVPAEVMRVVQTSESGRIIRKRGVGRGTRIVHAEQETRVDEALPPMKYFGGQFKYMPIPECGVLVNYMKFIKAEYPMLKLSAVCATCQCELGREDLENYVGKTRVIGIASDHARTTVNHAVFVMDMETGMYLYQSPYRILATCSK